MSVKAIDINATQEYICKSDRESKDQTVFLIGNIDSITLADIEVISVDSRADGSNKFDVKLLGRDIDYVRYGLKGWRNFKVTDKDKEGKEYDRELEFVTTSSSRCGKTVLVASDMCIKRIPPSIINELAEAIKAANKLSIEEIKN